MPEPKPPEGYDTWLEFAIATIQMALLDHAIAFEQSSLDYCLDELAELRKDAEQWRAANRKLEKEMAANREQCRLLREREPRKDDDNDN